MWGLNGPCIRGPAAMSDAKDTRARVGNKRKRKAMNKKVYSPLTSSPSTCEAEVRASPAWRNRLLISNGLARASCLRSGSTLKRALTRRTALTAAKAAGGEHARVAEARQRALPASRAREAWTRLYAAPCACGCRPSTEIFICTS